MKKYAVLTAATGGGGGIAAKRVFSAIKRKITDHESIELIDTKSLGGALPYDVAPHQGGSNKIFSDTHYTVEFPGFAREEAICRLAQFDVLNVHWCSYLLTITELTRLAGQGIRIVFTCHDFYYFFGGCHYPHTCTRWLNGCVVCPQIDRFTFPDYDSFQNKQLKSNLLSHPNVFVTAPSQHVVSRAEKCCPSLIGKTRVIRNPISGDTAFNRKDRSSRENNKIKLLIIADSAFERRKAFSLACESVLVAAPMLRPLDVSIHVSFVGHGADSFQSILASRGVESVNYGKLGVTEIAAVYKSVDAILTTSLEDNWPNILVEGLACGTLAICGPGHGCEEFITSYNCGIVADSYSPHAFAVAITVLSDRLMDSKFIQTVDYEKFRHDHDESNVAKTFLDLFRFTQQEESR